MCKLYEPFDKATPVHRRKTIPTFELLLVIVPMQIVDFVTIQINKLALASIDPMRCRAHQYGNVR